MSTKWVLALLLINSLFACQTTSSIQKKTPSSQAAKIINKAIAAHGGAAFEKGTYSFDFRNKEYTVTSTPTTYQYTRQETKENTIIKDKLTDKGFQRQINGQSTTLSDKDQAKYSNSLNSVIYFVLLPYKLNDPAVIKKYKGVKTIKGNTYHTIEITFQQEGGGTDFEDVFYYWIHQDHYTIDYLAYQFHVNKGGVRFRQAINPRKVNGVRFQDYINFKSPKDTPLATLPALFEKNKLEKLSVIELENVTYRY